MLKFFLGGTLVLVYVMQTLNIGWRGSRILVYKPRTASISGEEL
jgi:hypothetical protein